MQSCLLSRKLQDLCPYRKINRGGYITRKKIEYESPNKSPKEVKKDSPKEIEKDSPRQTYDLKYHRKFRGMKNWLVWWKVRRKPDRTVLINMELINGMHKSFVVVEEKEGFYYRGKKYLIDNENKYFHIDAKMFAYDYHEEISLPIVRKIPVGKIKTVLEASPITEVEYAINPATLKRFEIAKIAEGIMKGQALDEFMRRIMVILFIVLIVTIIHFMIFLQKSGVFSQITGSVGIG